MTMVNSISREDRFLILTPTGRDADLTHRLLARAGIASEICRDVAELRRLAARGVAGLLVAEEALDPEARACLIELLAAQPSWSDLPVLVFTGRQLDTDQAFARVVEPLGNVIVLNRPLPPITMTSAARAALRARRRQYAARAELEVQERAVRNRDQFLAMLGHELRNPLSAITMSIELLGQAGADEPRYRAIVRRQANTLTRLVDDLLDVSRVTSGKINLHRERVDLTALTRRCTTGYEKQAEENRLELSFDLPDTPVYVTGDPVRLEQVLVNLITNALKYTPPGGHVHVSLAADTDQVRLQVVDDGTGIDREMLPLIFDLFSQASTTIDRAKGGLGIGLMLVRSLVEHHRGTVTADSEGLGRGSVFTVTLPRLQVSTQAETGRAAHGDGRGAPREILIVEDNRDCRETLSMLLEADGHHIDAVGDGLEAVDHATERHPDVMIIDIGLPGIDGYEVARRVRQHEGNGVFLIALTGYGQPRDRSLALQAGFHHHFTKPVDVEQLRQVLSQRQD